MGDDLQFIYEKEYLEMVIKIQEFGYAEIVFVLDFIKQWSPTFLLLWPLNTISHVVVSPSHKFILIAAS